MSYATHANTYREMEVLSASPGQLVVMLYDHLLVTLRRARLALDGPNTELRGTLLEKARNVVAELLSTLDVDAGGDIARNLSGLYTFFFGEMVDLASKPDVTRLDRLTAMVGELRDAFARAAGPAEPWAQ